MKIVTFGLVSICLLANGCKKKEPEPQPGAVLLSPAGQNAQGPQPPASAVPPSQLPMGLTWEDPSGWERVALNNPMRKATYRVPKVEGDPEDAELAVFYFGPGQGGSIEANVERWVSQFSGIKDDDVKRANRSAHGLRQHTVEINKGTFASGMPGGPTRPKENFGMLGGIVEAPSGPYFFKMTGPAATVRAAKEKFYGLLDSCKAN